MRLRVALTARNQKRSGLQSELYTEIYQVNRFLDGKLLAEFLLPKIIKDFADSRVFRQYNQWMTTRSDSAAQQGVAGDASQAAPL
jgi:hypothetical protein